MKIARVFPTRTSMSPIDEDAYFDLPYWFTPKYDEVHISVTFTWDLAMADHLAMNWERYGKVKLGSPALDAPGKEFIPGMYLKKGIVITSRGCPNRCPHCFVPGREGKLRELPITEGNIIQDNNLLACSKEHIRKVFAMLKDQKQVDFPGGFEASRVTDKLVEQLRSIRIYQMWLAYDLPGQDKPLKKAVKKLSKYFNDRHIRCYVLIGYKDDTMEKAEKRLREVYNMGALPFAMLYKDKDNTPQTKEWKQFQRKWIIPRVIRVRMKKKGD